MKFLLKSIIVLFLLSINAFCFAQSDNPVVGLEHWRIHLPYYDGVAIAEGNGKVFCATRYGFFGYNTSDQSIERFSRVTGLSDFEISTIRYSPEDHLLLVAYQDANIDLIYDDHKVVNLPYMKLKNIIGGKSINHIFFLNHFAYLSCSFGIVVVNLAKLEIKDTYYPSIDGSDNIVYSLTSYGSKLYAATQTGIFIGDVNDPFLRNYAEWTRDVSVLNNTKPFTSIVSFSGSIFAVYDTIKYQYNGFAWASCLPLADNSKGSILDTYNNHLVLSNGINFNLSVFDQTLNKISYIDNSSYTNAKPATALMDVSNILWIADENNGLVKYQNGKSEFIHPNSPVDIGAGAMASGTEGIWVASSTLVGSSCTSYPPTGSYWFNDNNWKSFYHDNDPIYASYGKPCMINIAVDPKDGKHAFGGTREHGLFEYRENGTVKVYNNLNSSLQAAYGNVVWVGGEAYDGDGNLWVTSSYTANQLSKMLPDGTWKLFSMGSAFTNTFIWGMLVDNNNQKWVNMSGTGLGVFYENDPDNPNDDNFKLLTNQPGNGNLPSITMGPMVMDKDGAIWIGTDAGVAVIYNPGSVFTQGANYDAQQILIQQDGHNQYLLATENVKSIAVDGANRKWFGTVSSGAYLMSADGTKSIYHFDFDNSPLLSNSVQSIAIDPVSGEVFFGTDKGICSFRGDATEGGDVCDNYYVFPNPIRHEYHGPIAIKGLVKNASVKIADVSGQVVYQTKANGGEAIWDGNNFSGVRAQTGVYLVYVTNDDGSETCVTKMLFTN